MQCVIIYITHIKKLFIYGHLLGHLRQMTAIIKKYI